MSTKQLSKTIKLRRHIQFPNGQISHVDCEGWQQFFAAKRNLAVVGAETLYVEVQNDESNHCRE